MRKTDLVEVIAGALPWTRFGFFGRPLMKAIWKSEFDSSDISHDQIFTDWAQVDRFADSFLSVVRPVSREGELALA